LAKIAGLLPRDGRFGPKAALASVALEPALIVAERKKRLEFLDNETIGNRRSWIWADETVRFFGVRAQSRL
jgi:hypothetical protein